MNSEPIGPMKARHVGGSAAVDLLPRSPVRANTTSQSSSWLHTVTLVLGWYVSNLGLVILNKALLSTFNFRFPFLLTLFHMLMCSSLSIALVGLNVIPKQLARSWRQVAKIVVLSVAFCLTILLGNISLKHIPVSFNQAIGATTPLFTAVLTLVLQHKRESLYTYLALVPVMGGISLAIRFEPSFHMFGFLICATATCLRAFKSVLQGMLLTDSEKMSSMALLMYMAPTSVVMLVPLTLWYEPGAITQSIVLMQNSRSFTALILLNCTLAYFVNLFNFFVTKHLGALTLQVLGNAKGIVAAVLSVMLFKNHVTVLGWAGYGITIAGVIAYSESKKLSSNSNNAALRQMMDHLDNPLHAPLTSPTSRA